MKKLVIDVDTGVDDAQAIMMALAAPNVEVLGITCVSGNTSLENSCRNTLRVLNVCQRLEIPVFGGAAEPLMPPPPPPPPPHGQDGLGDAPDPDAPGLELLQTEGAVEAIIRLVNKNPGEVGKTKPQTLERSVKPNPSTPRSMRNVFALGLGIQTRSFGILLGFPLAVAKAAATLPGVHINMKWYFFSFIADVWIDSVLFLGLGVPGSYGPIKHTMATCARYQREMTAGPGFVSCDSYAMAVPVAVTVELQGTYTRGMMVLDKLGVLEKEHQVVIMRTVDLESFKGMLDSLK
uniref:Inosine/uridine-preferring nucleoside hydrolase domain-containing protein n=1 Tax=Hucho hucho TaxID=62062 RepID=A0A4W5PM58_9TELE